jgi:hypothetical protein
LNLRPDTASTGRNKRQIQLSQNTAAGFALATAIALSNFSFSKKSDIISAMSIPTVLDKYSRRADFD